MFYIIVTDRNQSEREYLYDEFSEVARRWLRLRDEGKMEGREVIEARLVDRRRALIDSVAF